MAEPDVTIAALSPLLWWKLDEASGTTAANSGSTGGADTGTVGGGGAFGTTGFLPASTETVLRLDGVNDTLFTATSPAQGTDFAISLFFRTTQATGTAKLIYQVGTNEQIDVELDCDNGWVNFTIQASDGLLEAGGSQFYPKGSSVDFDTTPWNDGQMHLITLIFSAALEYAFHSDGYDGGLNDRTIFGSNGNHTETPQLNIGSGNSTFLAADFAHVIVHTTGTTYADHLALWEAAGGLVAVGGDIAAADFSDIDGPDAITSPDFYGGDDYSTTVTGPYRAELVDGGIDFSVAITGPDHVSPEPVIGGDDFSVAIDGPAGVASPFIVASIPSGEVVPGPALAFTTPPAPPDYLPVVTMELLDVDGTTVLSTLDDAYDIQWQDPLNDPGVGQFAVSLSDSDAALIKEGQFVRCSLYGVEAFTWRVETNPWESIVQDEEVGEQVSASGRGWLCILDLALTYPDGGVNADVQSADRLFSFAAPAFPHSGWVPAKIVQTQGTLGIWQVAGGAAPAGWLYQLRDTNWIWSVLPTTTVGKSYFRGSFTLGADETVTIAATADNLWTLYLDGVAILGDATNANAWQEHRKTSVDLTAGTHTLAAVVENLGLEAGFLCAVYKETSDGFVDTIRKITDTSWEALGYPTVQPGWTPGQIVLQLIGEAQARSQLPGLTWDFTDLTDSNGNAWPTIPEFQANVGDSLLTVLAALRDQGWIDYAMAPHRQRLSLWIQDGRGTSQPATYTAGLNIREMDHGQAQPIVNRLLVRYGGGTFVVNDGASQTATGMIVEGFLTLDTADRTEAGRLAAAALTAATSQQPAIAMGIEPRQVTADRPYIDWNVGDSVLAPARDGASTRYRVLSVSVTENDMGDVELALEVNRRSHNADQNRVNLLKELGGGVVGNQPGSSAVAGPGGAYPPIGSTIDGGLGGGLGIGLGGPGGSANGASEVVFDYTGHVDTLLTSDPWEAPFNLTIVQVVLRTNNPGVSDVSVDVNGTTVTLPGGASRVEVSPNTTLNLGSVLAPTLTDFGAGDVDGLTILVRYAAGL